jgi:predicted secreted protein
MRLTSAIAIYFIVWWVCLFAVLPWGVRNANEAGETVNEGHEAGAPVNPMLWRKILATTMLASIVFALILGQITYGWIAFEDIPFLGGMPTG